MTPLLLVLSIVALFAVMLAYESAGDDTQPKLNPAGLFTWLISGNWPAKVGATLVIIGVGALLRYAFANIDVPPESKLGAGVACSALLGMAAAALRNKPMRRAIHLALAGAAFGVAYLTAYSAYGFFNYITDVNALALLALVAVAAGVFAVSSNAMSVAILAMIGAYIAPRFAIGSPGIMPVYGYYLAASILTLVMVMQRGWRPLIHLSFLFTLAAGLFFGWSGKFYAPEHFGTMQPLLLALTLVHVAMPLLERKHARTLGVIRFDTGYFVALPLVVSGLMLKIAPQLRPEGALGIAALAAIWGVIAAVLYGLKREEGPRHAFVATLLGVTAFFCYQQDLPWTLIGIGCSVAILAAAPMLGWSRNIQQLACAAATLLGALHITSSIMVPTPAQPFLNELFAHRIIAGTLMIVGAMIASRDSLTFGKILGVTGVGWALLSIVAELMRLHIDFLPQLVYGLLLGVVVLSVVISEKYAVPPAINGLLLLALVGCGWWAAHHAGEDLALIFLALTTLSLLGMAWSGRDTTGAERSDFGAALAIGLLPFALLPWAITLAEFKQIGTNLFEASVAMAGIVVAGLSARLWLSSSPRWNERIQPLHVYFTAFALLWLTLLHIERGIWPVVFEVLALAYLIVYVLRRSRERAEVGFGVGAMMVLSVALVLQAMLLRAFGPPDAVLDASDINRMHLPAVASLMWAIFGGCIAWWGSYSKSRTMWSAGAVLLVVAAIKLVFFDFGELGQLGNIIAFIAAGVVFLGVAWFAPIPPKPEPKADQKPTPPEWKPTQPNRTEPPAPAPRQSQAEERSEPQSSMTEPIQAKAEQNESAEAPPRPTPMPRSASNASRYKNNSQGINGLWFLFLGLAIAIAMIGTGWQKQQKRKKAYEHYQQQLDASREPQAATQAPAPPPADDAHYSKVQEAPAATPTAPPSEYRPGIATTAAATTQRNDACSSFAGTLPSDYALYAAGSYAGKKIGFQIDQSGHEGTQIDVVVNSPNIPVVLMLGAYEPTIWNISRSENTKILAVLVSGHHRQAVAGLEKNLSLLISTRENRGTCGYFYVSPENLAPLNPLANRIFGRPVDMVFPAKDGKVVIGDPVPEGTRVVSSPHTSPESFRDMTAPIAGIAGLEDAVRRGLLRRATTADAEAWSEAVSHNSPRGSLPPVAGQGIPKPPKPVLHNAYVVLMPFTFPSGLFGAHSATFFVPKGVPRPNGNPGHSAIYDFNTLACQGALCGSR